YHFAMASVRRKQETDDDRGTSGELSHRRHQSRQAETSARTLRSRHGARPARLGRSLPCLLRDRGPALLHADALLARGNDAVLAWLERQPDAAQFVRRTAGLPDRDASRQSRAGAQRLPSL